MTVAMLKIKNRANLVKKSLRYNSLYYLLLFFCNYGWFLVVFFCWRIRLTWISHVRSSVKVEVRFYGRCIIGGCCRGWWWQRCICLHRL